MLPRPRRQGEVISRFSDLAGVEELSVPDRTVLSGCKLQLRNCGSPIDFGGWRQGPAPMVVSRWNEQQRQQEQRAQQQRQQLGARGVQRRVRQLAHISAWPWDERMRV